MDDIDYFKKQTGKGRETNDKANKCRERVIEQLVLPETGEAWNHLVEKHPDYIKLRISFWKAIGAMYQGPFDNVSLVHRGTRRHTYDYEIELYSEGALVFSCKKLEFKFNARTIDHCPQYLTVDATRYVHGTTYAEHFYDRYIQRVCCLSETLQPRLPDRATYLSKVHTTNYECHPFFKELYRVVKSDKRNEKTLSKLAKESISSYLNSECCFKLDDMVQEIQKQASKLFLLWDTKKSEFILDKFSSEELSITGLQGVKLANSLVLSTACKSEHHALLRWKNNNCILLPAWQIKLVRSKPVGKALVPFSRVHCYQRNS
jgi:hypothetical protein